MILDPNKSIYACNDNKKEAYEIGTRRIWEYDPYTKSIGKLKEEYMHYTYTLSLHSLSSFGVSRCRTTVATHDDSILIVK